MSTTTVTSSSDDLDRVRELLVDVPAPTGPDGQLVDGWVRVAVALSILSDGDSAILTVEFTDSGPMVIDWSRGRFWWNTSPENRPASPRVSRIRLARGPEARLPFMREEPYRLEPLLWAIGREAFAGGPAPWLTAGARYRLTAWPNLTGFAHDADQLRMIAQLSAAALAVDELASAVNLQPGDAQLLINSLSLMGLVTEKSTAAAHSAVAAAPPSNTGLFGRLRARLGR